MKHAADKPTLRRSVGAASRLKIGVSACFLHPDPQRAAFGSKTLQYLEQSMAHWIMGGGALPVLVPSPAGDTARDAITLEDYAQWLDGVVMHGGVDLWPGSYGEQPLRPEWKGDAIRDAYEIALVRAFVAAGKPVFGICRGLQLINVAYGGTLYQDINHQVPGTLVHRDGVVYDNNLHEVQIVPSTRLGELLAAEGRRTINSIHHQGIKDLAPGFCVEARSADDGIIEAIRRVPSGGDALCEWVAAVQWHPEFHRSDQGVIDDTPLLQDFLAAAARARQTCVG